MSQDNKQQVIDFVRCLERRDWAGARAMCAATATVWSSNGQPEQTIEENLDAKPKQVEAVESMRYDITRQFAQPNEVLQQHVIQVAMKDGTRGQVHAAEYYRFEGGLITRIEMYADFVPSDPGGSGA